MDLSIVISLYNEVESLPELVSWIHRSLEGQGLDYEIILVDDGSTDGSWDFISGACAGDSRIHGIRFRRNYGKSAALYCGFDAACGDIVVTMDADLQDSPEEIPEMIRMIREEGYDLVSGWKQKRHDNVLMKNIPSKIYNSTARRVTGLKLHDMNCGLKAYRKDVVKNIEVYGEMHRFIPYLAKNAGFLNIGEKVVHHQARKYGKSKFGMDRFIHGFLDLLSIWFLQIFGKKPMHLFGAMGVLTFLIGAVIAIWLIIDKLVSQAHGTYFRAVTDQPLFYLALVAVILGAMLFLTGFLGELIARNAPERNRYNIRERL
ncbi:MAG: glycosyltransferase [Bacteroidales bacterium]|nr:glycosyltransferase [Bacteroidales bacterium]